MAVRTTRDEGCDLVVNAVLATGSLHDLLDAGAGQIGPVEEH